MSYSYDRRSYNRKVAFSRAWKGTSYALDLSVRQPGSWTLRLGGGLDHEPARLEKGEIASQLFADFPHVFAVFLKELEELGHVAEAPRPGPRNITFHTYGSSGAMAALTVAVTIDPPFASRADSQAAANRLEKTLAAKLGMGVSTWMA